MLLEALPLPTIAAGARARLADEEVAEWLAARAATDLPDGLVFQLPASVWIEMKNLGFSWHLSLEPLVVRGVGVTCIRRLFLPVQQGGSKQPSEFA